MSATASQASFPSVKQNLNLALLLFACLQILDLVSTVLVFAHGGMEMNPVVRAFMPYTGRIAAVIISKIALFVIVCAFARRRRRVLVIADGLYTAVVIWNVAILNALV